MESLPSGEVWIEIAGKRRKAWERGSHFPQGKCGLKSGGTGLPDGGLLSLPSGEVWIEIDIVARIDVNDPVTSLRGSVD